MDKIVLLCSFFITVISIVRCFYASNRKTSDVFLNITLFTLLVNTVVFYLVITSGIYDFPHFYRIGTLSTFIFIPASYLYIRYALTKGAFNRLHLLLFLPALVFLIDYLPFFISDYNAKVSAINYDFSNNTGNKHLQSAFIPNGTHFLIQNAMGVILAIHEIYVIYRHIRMGGRNYYSENSMMLNWHFAWGTLLFFSCLPDFLLAAFGLQLDLKTFTYVTPCLLLYFFYPFSILINPELLYGSKGFWLNKNMKLSERKFAANYESNLHDHLSVQQIPDILQHSLHLLTEVKFKTSNSSNGLTQNSEKFYFNEKLAFQMKEDIETYIRLSKIYLNPDLTLENLADVTHYHQSQISSLLDKYCGISFDDFINAFRIEEFIRKYAKNGSDSNLNQNIDHLLSGSGFKNKPSFLKAFKRVTGTSLERYFFYFR